MISSDYIDNIVLGVIDAALAACLLLMILSSKSPPSNKSNTNQAIGTGSAPRNEKTLLDTDMPISVNVLMGTDDWKDLLTIASEKKWHCCAVIINGTHFSNQRKQGKHHEKDSCHNVCDYSAGRMRKADNISRNGTVCCDAFRSHG